MTRPTHPELVAALAKPGKEILATLTAHKVALLHMVLGMETEIGEIATAIKEHVIYNKPLDDVNLIEESGDLSWYHEGFRQLLGVTREFTTDRNIDKLIVRYKGMRYSDIAATARADKESPPKGWTKTDPPSRQVPAAREVEERED